VDSDDEVRLIDIELSDAGTATRTSTRACVVAVGIASRRRVADSR